MSRTRVFYLALVILLVGSLFLSGCGEKELGTEENPIILAVVPSGETETVVAGFDEVASLIYDETGLVVEPFVATEYAWCH